MYQQQQSMTGYPTNPINLQTSVSGNVGTGSSQTDNSGTGMRPEEESSGSTDTDGNQQEQQQQPIYAPQQWNWNLPQYGAPFQFPGTRIGQIYLRMTAGMPICHTGLECRYIIQSI